MKLGILSGVFAFCYVASPILSHLRHVFTFPAREPTNYVYTFTFHFYIYYSAVIKIFISPHFHTFLHLLTLHTLFQSRPHSNRLAISSQQRIIRTDLFAKYIVQARGTFAFTFNYSTPLLLHASSFESSVPRPQSYCV